MTCATFVYKRRKLRNSFTFLSKEDAIEISRPCDGGNSSFICSDVNHLLRTIKKDDLEKIEKGMNDGITYRSDASNGINSPASLPADTQLDGNVILALASVPEDSLPASKIIHRQENDVNRLTTDHNSIVNESCSSSKSSVELFPALADNGKEDVCVCLSPSVKGVAQQADCHPSKEFCINVLKSSRLIGGSWPIKNEISLDVLGGNDAGSFQQCNACGLMGNPQRMLICDLCEEAVHMSCCGVTESPRDEWYCQPCHGKKPRPLLDVAAGKLFPTVSEEYKRRILQQELGPIQFMLTDTQPYTSGVRIGNDFQVEVPEWSGPISDDCGQFDESTEFNLDCGSVKEWNSTRSSKPSSIGNWLQCREVVCNGPDDNDGVVCGKWRRAPLFATQTDDWDCSCSVVWDPFHADCAVPQELETDGVLKHLKYVELIKARLNKRKRSG